MANIIKQIENKRSRIIAGSLKQHKQNMIVFDEIIELIKETWE